MQGAFKDMRKNDKKSTDEELYRASAIYLYSDKRDEEAKTCCDNIKDEILKKNVAASKNLNKKQRHFLSSITPVRYFAITEEFGNIHEVKKTLNIYLHLIIF